MTFPWCLRAALQLLNWLWLKLIELGDTPSLIRVIVTLPPPLFEQDMKREMGFCLNFGVQLRGIPLSHIGKGEPSLPLSHLCALFHIRKDTVLFKCSFL